MFQGSWLQTITQTSALPMRSVFMVALVAAAVLGRRPPTPGALAVGPDAGPASALAELPLNKENELHSFCAQKFDNVENTSADAEKTANEAKEAALLQSTGAATEDSLSADEGESSWPVSFLEKLVCDLISVVCGSILMCLFYRFQTKTTKKINEKAHRSEPKTFARAHPVAAPPAPIVQSPAFIALSEGFYAQVRQGNLAGASKALTELEAEGKPSVQEYTAIISLCTKANDAESGHMWLVRAKEMCVCPSSVCYNGVINAYVKRCELKNAVALAIEMKACGVPLDTVTYNTLIDGCARSGDAESAEWWMNTMLTAKVKPSVVTIGSMMLACAREGNSQRALHWLETADSLGIVVNMICFSAVINAFAKAGDLDTADKWLSMMKLRDVQPSIHCFTGMLENALKTLNIDRAAEIYKNLRAAGVQPDAALFNWLVTSAARAGEDVRAQAWADEACALGFRLNRTARRFVKYEPLDTAPAKPVDSTPPEQECEVDDAELDERAQELIGKRVVGTIKNYIHGKFGYVVCEESYAVFKRDVFLSSNDNPQEFGKGQRVSFVLFLDKKRNLPRACQLEVASAKAQTHSSTER